MAVAALAGAVIGFGFNAENLRESDALLKRARVLLQRAEAATRESETAPRPADDLPVLAAPAPALADGCAGRETFCAAVATDDPGATLQPLGAAWRAGEARRYRVRVVVAPDAP